MPLASVILHTTQIRYLRKVLTDNLDTPEAEAIVLALDSCEPIRQPEPPALPYWSALFPEGRFIFYEGDDPKGFADELVTRFGFDPSQQPSFTRKRGWGFHCPVEILDEVYGSNKYPMGS